MEVIILVVFSVILGLCAGRIIGRYDAFDELIESGDIEKFIDENGEEAVRAKREQTKPAPEPLGGNGG